jgi:hypothetical protein
MNAKAQVILPATDDPLLITRDAATYLHLAARTLERMRVDGTGPTYFKAGPGLRARVLYRRSDLDRWLRSFTSTSEY